MSRSGFHATSLFPHGLDPCRPNCFQVPVNPTMTLQTEGTIYVEHRYCARKPPRLHSGHSVVLLQENSKALSRVFFQAPVSLQPPAASPVGISEALNGSQGVIFHLEGWQSREGFGLWKTKEISKNRVAQVEISQGSISDCETEWDSFQV